jgi:hypothetical protein
MTRHVRTVYVVGWTDFRGDVPRGGTLETYSRAEAYAFRKAKRAEGCEADHSHADVALTT